MSSGSTDHAARLLRRRWLAVPPRCGQTRVLAIDGRSGTGKSSLADAVLRLAPDGTRLVRLEDLYPGWDGLEVAQYLLADGVFAPLAAGWSAHYHRFDWDAGVFADRVEVGRPRWLIVEGVGALSVATRDCVSVGVWLSASETDRRTRALERDGDLFRPHWHRWAAQEALYLRTQRPDRAADLRLRT